ncbi:MAG: class I tRNA ligase family protein, partial [Deltaproteobacteria bacterium]|nr:class I tRNA ligase family protein [Deltaproteobacteria bacterium]
WLVGLSVWDANERVVEHLRTTGHLVHDHTFTHSYPHDWRSRTPVIFRSTEQWFIGVDQETAHGASLRQLALGAAEADIAFYPQWGANRLRGMLESRPDWCLSRQRAWGLPIPAFTMPDGTVFLTPASVRAVGVAFGARGSDAWFTESPAQLLADYDQATDPDAPAGLDLGALGKMHDIFDVWFESGSSWHAVMRRRGDQFPVDLYLEGSDQHRGWFQLSLLPALGMTGQPPFRALLTHGFTVDKDGKKMSKSLGNALDVDELLQHYGADVCRWWVSSVAFENDIKLDMDFFEQAGESYRKVRNTIRFLLSNLSDFDPEGDGVELGSISPTTLDAWVLGAAVELDRQVRAAFDTYEFRRAHQAIYDFCNDTLSAVYCAATKDRLYCDSSDAPRRRTAQTVMWHLTSTLCRLLAPILPHTADEAWKALVGDDAQSVHLLRFQAVASPEVDSGWSAVMDVREDVLKALEAAKATGIENPLDAQVQLPDPEGVLVRFQIDLPDLLGVSRVELTDTGSITINDLSAEPRCQRCWKRDGTVKQRSDGGMLSDRDAAAVGVQ